LGAQFKDVPMLVGALFELVGLNPLDQPFGNLGLPSSRFRHPPAPWRAKAILLEKPQRKFGYREALV
jgi:hypothetical protein